MNRKIEIYKKLRGGTKSVAKKNSRGLSKTKTKTRRVLLGKSYKNISQQNITRLLASKGYRHNSIKYTKRKPLGKSTSQVLSTNRALSELTQKLFSKEQLDILKSSHVDTNRALFELTSPTSQCNNIIGKSIKNHDRCYLCGFTIYENDPALGLMPECEHVLPIAQAVFFLGLYDNTYKKIYGQPKPHIQSNSPIALSQNIKEHLEKTPEKYNKLQPIGENNIMNSSNGGSRTNEMNIDNDRIREVLQLEYRWAHRVCNRIKSDTSFITFKGDMFIPDVYNIKNTLNDIGRTTREDSITLKYLLYKNYKLATGSDKTIDVDKFINKRSAYVIDIIKQICDILNRGGAPGLVELIGATKLLEAKDRVLITAKIIENNNLVPDNLPAVDVFANKYNEIIESLQKNYSTAGFNRYKEQIAKYADLYKNNAKLIYDNTPPDNIIHAYINVFISIRILEQDSGADRRFITHINNIKKNTPGYNNSIYSMLLDIENKKDKSVSSVKVENNNSMTGMANILMNLKYTKPSYNM